MSCNRMEKCDDSCAFKIDRNIDKITIKQIIATKFNTYQASPTAKMERNLFSTEEIDLFQVTKRTKWKCNT